MSDYDDSQEEKDDMARVDKALQVLGEFFDTVQIMATRVRENRGGTVYVSKGTGNWYARYGQAKAWVTYEENGFRESKSEGGDIPDNG